MNIDEYSSVGMDVCPDFLLNRFQFSLVQGTGLSVSHDGLTPQLGCLRSAFFLRDTKRRLRGEFPRADLLIPEFLLIGSMGRLPIMSTGSLGSRAENTVVVLWDVHIYIQNVWVCTCVHAHTGALRLRIMWCSTRQGPV